MVPREAQRATHEDRDRVVDVLRLAAGDSRLTLEELDERVGTALTARTYGELTALVSDLPAAPDTPAGPPGTPEPKDLVIEGVHSGARRNGQWLVPQRIQLRVTTGTMMLDFTQAILSWPLLQIDVEARGGAWNCNVYLVTRPGILVDTDDLEIRHSTVKVIAPWGPDVPVRFRIDLAGTVDSCNIEAGPPRRTLGQRLQRRQPLLQPLPPIRP